MKKIFAICTIAIAAIAFSTSIAQAQCGLSASIDNNNVLQIDYRVADLNGPALQVQQHNTFSRVLVAGNDGNICIDIDCASMPSIDSGLPQLFWPGYGYCSVNLRAYSPNRLWCAPYGTMYASNNEDARITLAVNASSWHGTHTITVTDIDGNTECVTIMP